MSISRRLKVKFETFDMEDRDRIIRMAWEDRTSYEAIYQQFGLTPGHLVAYMRYVLPNMSFKRWRRRIYETGHLKNTPHTDYRFKCSSQRMDGSTKSYK
jgi:uncharacterized protein (TIGR03643 family)